VHSDDPSGGLVHARIVPNKRDNVDPEKLGNEPHQLVNRLIVACDAVKNLLPGGERQILPGEQQREEIAGGEMIESKNRHAAERSLDRALSAVELLNAELDALSQTFL
jgi:hypothetical protein